MLQYLFGFLRQVKHLDSESDNKQQAESFALRLFTHLDKRDLAALCCVNKALYKLVKQYHLRVQALSIMVSKGMPFPAGQFDLTTLNVIESNGWTNSTFILARASAERVLRIPGKGTTDFLNRRDEEQNARRAVVLGFNPEILYFDEEGFQLATFLTGCVPMNNTLIREPHYMMAAAQLLKKLHESGEPFANKIDVFKRNKHCHDLLARNNTLINRAFLEIYQSTQALSSLIEKANLPFVPTHSDTTPPNFLWANDKMHLIDYEYSGNNRRSYDLAFLSVEARFNNAEDAQWLQAYFGEDIPETERACFHLFKPIIEIWVALWCDLQILNQSKTAKPNEFADMRMARLANAREYLQCERFTQAQKYLESMADAISNEQMAASYFGQQCIKRAARRMGM